MSECKKPFRWDALCYRTMLRFRFHHLTSGTSFPCIFFQSPDIFFISYDKLFGTSMFPHRLQSSHLQLLLKLSSHQIICILKNECVRTIVQFDSLSIYPTQSATNKLSNLASVKKLCRSLTPPLSFTRFIVVLCIPNANSMLTAKIT